MMSNKEIRNKAFTYCGQMLFLLIVLKFGFKLWGGPSVAIPRFVAATALSLFYLVDAGVWYWVASCHKDYLPSFFTGTSTCRFLLALAVIGGYYLLGPAADLMTFVMVFVIYYVVLMMHHSIFFSRVSNRL